METDAKSKDNSIHEFSGISLDISSSTSTVCRICQDSKCTTEPLISPCQCAGSMGFFHTTCLEKWLGLSQSNKCEVCKFEFRTVRVSRPFGAWVRYGTELEDRRYAYVDLCCFIMLTPLACLSSWLCTQGALQYYKNGEHWTGFGLIMLSVFLVLMYLFWVCITCRYHLQSYKRWRGRNQIVRVVLENHELSTAYV